MELKFNGSDSECDIRSLLHTVCFRCC